jgi:hypothetical protein
LVFIAYCSCTPIPAGIEVADAWAKLDFPCFDLQGQRHFDAEGGASASVRFLARCGIEMKTKKPTW